jgi:hypothetical protein
MKLFAASLLIGLLPVKAAPVDHGRLIETIGQIEGGKWGEPGGTGCMNLIAWHQHTRLTYDHSAHPETTLPVYHAHLSWLETHLVRRGFDATPAMLYLCWRRGLRGGIREFRTTGISEAAIRCQNLYESMESDDRMLQHKR